jgi:hypothetical protein
MTAFAPVGRFWLGCTLLVAATAMARASVGCLTPNEPNVVEFPSCDASFVRVMILSANSGEPGFDEVEILSAEDGRNVALSSLGAKATASSCLPGYSIHRIAHLNDGNYGNNHSWIAAARDGQWAQVALPKPMQINKVILSRDREGRFADRMPRSVAVQISLDGSEWHIVAAVVEDPVLAAFARERVTWQHIDSNDHLSPLKTDRPAVPGGAPYWNRIAKLTPVERLLVLMEELCDRMAAKGVDVSAERQELARFKARQQAIFPRDTKPEDALYLDVRHAKRRLLLRDPDLVPARKIVFVKRHPYLSSHNYSDVMDSQFLAGGGVCTLEIAERDGRLDPENARLTTLFDASAGIARDPMLDFEAKRVYFAFRPEHEGVTGYPRYWHLMVVNLDGSGLRQLTDGPYHDMYPCPLPDDGLAFISTRCEKRFLCWRPQAYVLYRMDDPLSAKPSDLHPLSYANLTEWAPSVMQDGRILWTRSEYLDKGANFGHTLWAIHPDGIQPTLVFGNDTPNCYINAHELPGSHEILCTLYSHGGDHNGPLGIIDLSKRPFDPTAITNITPDARPHYDMDWPQTDCFRDPVPISRDYFLASYNAGDRFELFLVDRYGNREWLYGDPEIDCMAPSPLWPTPRPPVLASHEITDPYAPGQFSLADVYQGLPPSIPRGKIKYLRVCEEVASALPRMANGELCQDCGEDFQDYYASPTHLVQGPYGWPTFVAKASLGLVPVEADGSASFTAPAGKVLYFIALDADLNEIQRMRSVVQLQPGERRSCIGCHDDRKAAPPSTLAAAMRRPPGSIGSSPWGTDAFSYDKVVQPVWDARCVSCHNAEDKKLNLSGALDQNRVPASYKTLITGGWVHYFSLDWGQRHYRAEPANFGTLKSKLWDVLKADHYGVTLTPKERERIKCWTDLNCPLWPDYVHRPERPIVNSGSSTRAR